MSCSPYRWCWPAPAFACPAWRGAGGIRIVSPFDHPTCALAWAPNLYIQARPGAGTQARTRRSSDPAEPNVNTHTYQPGRLPVLMSIPHLGTRIPADISRTMTDAAMDLADTDWHLDQLYAFAADRGLAVLMPEYSRYVIDLNRAPDGADLYPGADNTELVPSSTFARQPLYQDGLAPDAAEVARRREAFWMPYHDRIRAALDGMVEAHGVAVLFDCHSIASHVPRFFDGRLPDFNLGTAGGASCHPTLQTALAAALETHGADYTLAVNGRFKGGYITRHYGAPARGVHAFQMELSQITYMDEEPPFIYRPDQAARVQPALAAMVDAAVDWVTGRG
ncbi:MAG: N-formylglutamate deformylase [Rhodobacterales bacterium]|nr:N-formylglutamate deformylase [Rhodobacterales bacterium]